MNRRLEAQKYIAQNRAAKFHYDVTARYEAGIVLRGSEVKSLRDGRVDISEAYASVERGEVWIRQMYIASYLAARAFPHTERGTRKLLLRAREIREIERAVLRERYTLIPLDLYFKDGWVKVTLGVARGKKAYDKRRAVIEREAERETAAINRAHREPRPAR